MIALTNQSVSRPDRSQYKWDFPTTEKADTIFFPHTHRAHTIPHLREIQLVVTTYSICCLGVGTSISALFQSLDTFPDLSQDDMLLPRDSVEIRRAFLHVVNKRGEVLRVIGFVFSIRGAIPSFRLGYNCAPLGSSRSEK
jgi:hypothetical protein